MAALRVPNGSSLSVKQCAVAQASTSAQCKKKAFADDGSQVPADRGLQLEEKLTAFTAHTPTQEHDTAHTNSFFLYPNRADHADPPPPLEKKKDSHWVSGKE